MQNQDNNVVEAVEEVVKKAYLMRFRYWYMIIGGILVTLLLLLSDPDLGIIAGLPFGGHTVATFVFLSKTVLYAAILHITRKGLTDYLDLEAIAKKAVENPVGAGLLSVAVSVIMLSIAILILAAVK